MFAVTVVWETLQPHPTAFKKKNIKKLFLPLFCCFKHSFYPGDRNEGLLGTAVSTG